MVGIGVRHRRQAAAGAVALAAAALAAAGCGQADEPQDAKASGVDRLPPQARGEVSVPARPSSSVSIPGRLLVRSVPAGRPEFDGRLYELAGDDAPRRIGRLRCRRFHASPAGPALCLRVAANGFDYEAVTLDHGLRSVDRRRIEGVPSRARVSPDGRYGAFTTFADDGQGYFADTSEFSAWTRIVDMRTGGTLLRLEQLDVHRRGAQVELADAEFWGVSFGEDGRFYATLAPGGEVSHLLIEGRVGSRRASVVGDHVECPSLSPDGTRIAYKRRVGESDGWRLHVRDLDSGRDVALAETSSIDDQPEWIGDRLIAYSDGKSVYAVPADGGGTPNLVAGAAASPAWLP